MTEIYAAMQIGEDHAAALMQYENETELSVLKCDHKMAELLSFCIKEGKRVLIISDMYQSPAFLAEALTRAGIKGYKALYVSSDENATKASGRLFQRVAEREKIADKKRWLHIGDDDYSDYAVPKAMGINACLYDNGRMSRKKWNKLIKKAARRLKMRIRAAR